MSHKQFWLAPAGVTVTFWADHDIIHLTIVGTASKIVRSHLGNTDPATLAITDARPAGPPPLSPAEPGTALEIDRIVCRGGIVSPGNRSLLAAEILAGRRVSIRIEDTTLMFFDPDTRETTTTKTT